MSFERVKHMSGNESLTVNDSKARSSVTMAVQSNAQSAIAVSERRVMDRDLERLRGLPLFRHAPDLLLQRVLHVACLHEVEAGAMLIRPDQDGRDYLGLLDGELEICRSYTGPGGAEEIHLGRIVSAVDEIALIHAMPRLTSVRAVTAARVLSIDGERVEELLAWSQRYANELRDLAPLRTRMNIVGQAGPFRYLPLENVQQAFEALVPIDAQAGAVVGVHAAASSMTWPAWLVSCPARAAR